MNFRGESALKHAIQNNAAGAVEYLLDKNVDFGGSDVDNHNESDLLQYADSNTKRKLLMKLIERANGLSFPSYRFPFSANGICFFGNQGSSAEYLGCSAIVGQSQRPRFAHSYPKRGGAYFLWETLHNALKLGI